MIKELLDRPIIKRVLRVLAILIVPLTMLWMGWFDDALMRSINMEACNNPITMGYLLKARAADQPVYDYLSAEPVLQSLMTENPEGMQAYAEGRSQFERYVAHEPLLNALYVPFIKILGVTPRAIAWFNAIWGAVAVLFLALIAGSTFGFWAGWWAAMLLMTSLAWFLHMKVGYPAWMTSAALLCMLAWALQRYADRGARSWIALAGAVLGLLYLTGWISQFFGAGLIVLALLWLGPPRFVGICRDGVVALGVAVATAFAGSGIYAAYSGCGFTMSHRVMWEGMLERFKMGAVPGVTLSWPGRIAHGLKWMFFDMRYFDHPDKWLEGHPSVPLLFTVLFVGGVILAIRRRDASTRLALLWLVSVFAFLGAVFMYSHRYAILGLPAMALLGGGAAASLLGWVGRSRLRVWQPQLALLLTGWLVYSLYATRYDYRVRYLEQKQGPDLEMDRLRGHRDFADWLKAGFKPDDTLLVLSDPVMFPHTGYLFYLFDQPYPFQYWSRRFDSQSAPQQVAAWERAQFQGRRRIVLAFSTMGWPGRRQGVYVNDPRAFMALHPGIRPAWTFQYRGRTLIHAYFLEKPVTGPVVNTALEQTELQGADGR